MGIAVFDHSFVPDDERGPALCTSSWTLSSRIRWMALRIEGVSAGRPQDTS